jgi:hypothetical protein
MFQRGTTVESKLLQVGVALEALGYALWQESSPAAGAGTPNYPELLELVTSATAIEHPRIYGDLSTAEWRRAFNAAFKAQSTPTTRFRTGSTHTGSRGKE